MRAIAVSKSGSAAAGSGSLGTVETPTRRRPRVSSGTKTRAMMRVFDAIGRTTAVAPVRRALIADLVAAPLLDYEGESLAARLADEIAAVGASDERTALAPALERLRESTFRQRVVATAARADAPLDAALDAIAHLRVSGPALSLRLWIRHAAAGLDAGFDDRLGRAACERARG